MADIFALFDQIKSSTPQPRGPVTHLIVGLGNPGAQYDGTRHNIGFLCLDALASSASIRVNTAKVQALIGDGEISGKHVLLMKPQTYMNLSGDAVKAAADFYKIPAENIIVICDDISFDPGIFRIRMKGSHGGHNGLRSIEACLGSANYVRIKMGVGKKPHPEYDLADWVLGKQPKEDLDKGRVAAKDVEGAIKLILDGKHEEAMSRYSH